MRSYASIARAVRPFAESHVLIISLVAISLISCAGQGEEAPASETGGTGLRVSGPPAGTPPSGGVQGQPPPGGAAKPPAAGAGGGSPLDAYVEEAGAFLASTQAEDGSWDYFHSRSPDFAEPEPHAHLFGTAMVLMNLSHTGFEASQTFARGSQYVKGRMGPRHTWSLYEPGRFGRDHLFEPDSDDTAVALMVLAGRQPISREEAADVRALFDEHRAPGGLYRTYFDGFHGEKGFVPDPNPPSLGVNLNVLGFFGRYELERAGLMESLREAMKQERYWEKSPFYHSLPVLACLASNAVEHGAVDGKELLVAILTDCAAQYPGGAAGAATSETSSVDATKLHNLELAALVKARSHLCLLDAQPCRDLDPLVRELAQRRIVDGSWDPGPLYDYEVNHDALKAFVEGKGFAVRRERGGVGYDVERALASPGTARYYDGSRAETTSFALKALVFYRELLARRVIFANMPREE